MDDLPPLRPEDVVTQYGLVKPSGPDFKRRPQADQSTLSLIYGHVDVERAAELVQGRPARRRDAVRYSNVTTLLAAGFVVVRAPLAWFEEHLEVHSRLEWDDNQGERFDACFGEPTVWSR
ncbi:MAG: hypothetical protein M3285_13805 [Actinomycetota bacterium]|nr:hypothetical protein [Actinomycetota bacterium]